MKETEWIDPNDRLPKKGEKALIALRGGDFAIAKYAGENCGDKNWWWCDRVMMKCFKWTELPKHPIA